jgi:hypothetical protein
MAAAHATAHTGMHVTAGEFDALVKDLIATLDEFHVRAEDRAGRCPRAVRPDIVEIESGETGTPLPAGTGTLPAGGAVG